MGVISHLNGTNGYEYQEANQKLNDGPQPRRNDVWQIDARAIGYAWGIQTSNLRQRKIQKV